MNFIKRYIYISKSSFDSEKAYNSYSQIEANDRRLLITSISFPALLFSIIFSIYHIVHSVGFEIFTSLSFVLIFSSVILINKIIKNYKYITFFISFIASISFFVFFQIKGLTGYDSFWLLIVPALFIAMLGLGYGFIWSIAIYILSLISLIFTKHDSNSNIIVITFSMSYICIIVITSIYEWLRITSRLKECNAIVNFENEEKAHKEKKDLLFELSHQIRTPLNSIMGITNLMKQEELTQDQQEYVDAINTSVMNLSFAMSSMLNTSDNTLDNKILQNILYYDIVEIISHITKSYLAKHEKQNIKITTEISNYIPNKLTGNAKKLEQILEQIFDSIVLHSVKNETSLTLFINNKKETASAVELIFEIHTSTIKTNTTEEKIKSNDNNYTFASLIDLLDLSNTKKMVQANGGELIHKKKENIDVFEFNMLLWKSQIQDFENEKNYKKTSFLTNPKSLNEASILIVEDNLMNQKVLSMALEAEVKSIEIANNGKEALKLFESSKFDLILMDIQMPILDGYKTTAKIRVSEIGTNFHVPIIAITANVMNNENEKCIAYGMDDFIGKPFQMEILIEKMKFYLGKNQNN